jgi:hypothetical protein
VPYIASSVQTAIMGDLPTLKPGERTVLFEALDIADQYLLTSPGTYTVRFRGQDRVFGDVGIPVSNAILVRVSDGPVQPSRLIARRLFDMGKVSDLQVAIAKEGTVVPLGRSSSNGAFFTLRRGTRAKGGDLRVLIWVIDGPSAVEPNSQDAQRGLTAESIGRCQWGEVYLWSGAADAEELSSVRKLIETALKIEEH